MKPSLLRSLALVASSVLSLGLGASAAQAKTLDVVVVGDSYSAGVGAPNASGTCLRAPKAWGNVYAQSMRDRGLTVNFTNVACGGAVISDLDKQISAVTPETDLVLLTIGGNDIGFIEIVLQCFVPVISDPARCKSQIAKAVNNVPSVQAKVVSKVDALLARLRPGAKVGVLSYPYLADTSGFVLKGFFNQFEAGTPTRALGDLGDQVIKEVAAPVNAKAGYPRINYIPTKDLFVGHEPNQNPAKGNPNTWINEDTNAGGPFGLYHPNVAGYEAMAKAVVRAGGPDGDFGVAN